MSLLFLSLLCVLQKVTSSEWVQTQGRSGDTSTSVFSFTVQFKRASDTALDVAVEEIVNPSSPKFRHFLSSDDIAQLVAPIRSDATEKLQEHLQSVRDCSNVIVDMYSHGDFARVTTTEACVESWLKQQLFEYARGKFRIVRFASPVTIPREISAFVQHIHGVADKLPQAHTKPGSSAGKFPGDAVSPPKIRQVYGISVQGANKTSQAVAAFEDAEFKQSDCDEFLSNYSLPATKWGVIGPNNGGYFGEAGLDTQYLPATGSGIQSYFVSREQFDMLAWSLEVLNMSAPPHVLSVSWGAGESGYDASHIQAASSEFQKMAGMGISILTASGDQGTGKQGTFKCKKFDPTWPASSPWVTSVGGTYIESGSPEQGWSGSGGGFSAVFKRPAYQDARVKAYIGKAKLPPAGLFDAAGRATPDVSALATNYRVYSGGWGSISGTSAATPVFAGIISLINDRRIAQGKPTVGFLNTVLYGAAAGDSPVGSDIVTGDNKAPGCAAGFPATVGYDAITGLGTPDFAVLTKLLQQ